VNHRGRRRASCGAWAIALAVVLALRGCATACVRGQAELRADRPAEAGRHFLDALARRPDRLDALAGLAVAEYKLGEFERAAGLFERVTSRMPSNGQAHFYLGLARTVAAIDRALPLLVPGVPDAIRSFIAASLEDDLEWAAEVHDARTAPRAWLEPTWVTYSDAHAIYRHVHGVP
jgi:tetratricopeptide (TPR) repeat protein